MFKREGGLYGEFADLPLVAQTGHYRRMQLLDQLDVGDVSGKVCVDFGMGSWGFSGVYPKLHGCLRAVGLDLSSSAIESSLRYAIDARLPYAERFTVHQSDGMSLPLANESADIIFSGESIEHVRFPSRFLSECHRALRADGQLILTTPNRDAVIYRQMDEDYCVSPEHFWLFGHDDLLATLAEFFNVEESYGFNGSIGPGIDADFRDPVLAERWSSAFRDRPDLASGVVMRCSKKAAVTHGYVIDEVPLANIRMPEPPTRLALEFGLQGVLLDSAATSITIARPQSDGIVCRFWRHRWSGYAGVTTSDSSEEFDLYTSQAGWKNWVCDRATTEAETVSLRHTARKSPLALADQVIFFECFLYRRTS